MNKSLKQSIIKKISKIIKERIMCFAFFLSFDIVALLLSIVLENSFYYKRGIIFGVIPMISVIATVWLIIGLTYIPLYKNIKKINNGSTFIKELDVYKVTIRRYAITRQSSNISTIIFYYLENGKKQKLYYIPLNQDEFFCDDIKLGIIKFSIFNDSNIIEQFER